MKALDALTIIYARWAPRAVLALAMVVGCRPVGQAGRCFKDGQSPFTMTQAEIVNLEMDRLHRHVQPDGPVGVIWSEDLIEREGALAETRRAGAGWVIELDRKLTGFVLADTLVHEWSHCLAWTDDRVEHARTCGGHGPNWGIQFSRAYRAVWYDVDTPDAVAVLLPESQAQDSALPRTPKEGESKGRSANAGPPDAGMRSHKDAHYAERSMRRLW